MVTWSPSQANGWHPRVWCAGSSDVYVTYGFGQCHLAHLKWTGTAFTVVREELLVGTGSFAGRWLNPYILSVWTERGDVGHDYWERAEMDVRDGPWSLTVVEGPSPLVGGNWYDASLGHIYEQMGQRIRFDTVVLGTGFGAGAQQGEWVAAAETGDHLSVITWQNGVSTGTTRRSQTPLHAIGVSSQGDVAYGGYGPIWGWRNGMEQQDLTAVSWAWEGGPFPFFRPNGELWLGTTTYNEAQPELGAILRPWGGHLVIVVPGASVHVHVAEASGHFFVGTCTDTGGMTLTAVPVTTERVSLGLAETPEDSGGSSVGGGSTGSGTGWGVAGVTLTSKSTFEIVGAAEELIALPIEIFPAFPAESGYGRIIHPTLGSFDYEVKPDEWVNIDAEAIIAPVWASTRTLTSAANVLWEGNLRDVMVEERWKALGGLAMPITQLRMLLAIWTTPVDPDVGYVRWFPNYITSVGFKVIPVNLSTDQQGIAFDDVANYKDENGRLVGWMTNPVTFTLKLVERL